MEQMNNGILQRTLVGANYSIFMLDRIDPNTFKPLVGLETMGDEVSEAILVIATCMLVPWGIIVIKLMLED